MKSNAKKIILSSFFVIPLLLSPVASASSGSSTNLDTTKKDKPIYETRASIVPVMDYGGSDYWSYSKLGIQYTQSSPNFPATKEYREWNTKYDKWFSGNVYFQKSYWDANRGVYVAHYSGSIYREK